MANGTGTTADAPSEGGCATGSGEPETSDSLKAFGEVVKAFRKRAGLTQEDVAPRVRYSVPTVASVEQGRRFPPPDFVERAEDVLDAFGALRGASRHLSRRPGLASWFRQWARFEAEAISLYTYECRVLPGLLQTEAYARAVTFNVPPLADEQQLNDRITSRLARQDLLSTDRKPPTAFSFIVEQAVLERHTGGETVTRKLYALMPLRQPVHAGLVGPLQLAETPDNRCAGTRKARRTAASSLTRKR